MVAESRSSLFFCQKKTKGENLNLKFHVKFYVEYAFSF